MRFDYFFYAGHATIGELYGVSIYYLTELVRFWEANIYEGKKRFSNRGGDTFVERGIKPRDMSFSFPFWYIFCVFCLLVFLTRVE